MSRIAAGDTSAETLLVHKYWRGLYVVLYNDSRDQNLASDLAQEALCIALVKARNSEIREAKALTSFIHQTAKNLLIAHKRKEKRQKTDGYDNFDEVFSNLEGPAQQCERNELVKLVQQVLEELPMERDRKLLVGYFVDGLTKEQLCESLDLTDAHFDRVLYRARQRLKQKIALTLNQSVDDTSVVSLLSCVLVFVLQQDGTFATNVLNQVGETRGNEHSVMQKTSSAVKNDAQLIKQDLFNDII